MLVVSFEEKEVSRNEVRDTSVLDYLIDPKDKVASY